MSTLRSSGERYALFSVTPASSVKQDSNLRACGCSWINSATDLLKKFPYQRGRHQPLHLRAFSFVVSRRWVSFGSQQLLELYRQPCARIYFLEGVPFAFNC